MTIPLASSASSFHLSSDSKLELEMTLDDSHGLVIRLTLVTSALSQSRPIIHWGITTSDHPNVWVGPTPHTPALKHLQWDDNVFKLVPGAAQSEINDQHRLEFVFKGINLSTPATELPSTIDFVAHYPPDVWIKNGKSNFVIQIASFLQSAFTEKQMEQAISSVVSDRIAIAPKALTRTCRWNVQSKAAEFLLSNFVFSNDPDYCVVFFFTDTPHPLLLHWGCQYSNVPTWSRADVRQLLSTDPKNDKNKDEFSSHPVDVKALQTEFVYLTKSGESPTQYLRLVIGAGIVPPQLKFVLKEGKSNNWFKNNDQDFVVEIPSNPEYENKRKQLEAEEEKRREQEEAERKKREGMWTDALEKFRSDCDERKSNGEITYKHIELSEGIGEVDVVATFNEKDSTVDVEVIGCVKCPLTLHWGVVGEAGQRQRFAAQEWNCPPEAYRPPNTIVIDPRRSCESPMVVVPYLAKKSDKLTEEDKIMEPLFQGVTIKVPGKREAPGSECDPGVMPEVAGLAFVLRETDGSRWFKATDNKDIVIRLVSLASGAWSGDLPEVIEDILTAEIGWHYMTLYHRYNLINDAVSKWHTDQVAQPRQQRMGRSWTALFRPAGVCNIMDTPGQVVPERQLSSGAKKTDSEDAMRLCREFWSWMFVWSRFSYMGILDWQRNYNTKPKDLAHATECLTHKLANLWTHWTEYRPLIRLTLSTVARGGNQGQAIRDRILDLMHKHKIPENNANFYEQWHQKLHNNTTPDDIGICSALISYLRSGNMDEYWRVLAHFGVTRERLASYERRIVAEPYFVHTDIGSLIYDLEQYLDILKDVHDSLDLKKAFNYARGHLPHDAINYVQDVVNKTWVSGVALKDGKTVYNNQSTHELHERFLAVSEARRRVIYHLTRENISPEAARELLFLDFALEQQQGLALQGDSTNFSLHQLCKQLTDMAVCLSGHDSINEELRAASLDWMTLSNECVEGRFSSRVESALMLKAMADRLALIVGGLVGQWQQWFGPKSEYLGQQVGAQQKTLNVFVDEVLRGSILFGVSLTLKRLEPILREAASLPPWQMISVVPRIEGQLQVVDKLINIQDKIFDVPTILLSGSVFGEEEIPVGVQAVLVRSSQESPDILSHVSVRARNAHVLLGVCFDPSCSEDLAKLANQWIELTVPGHGGDLAYKQIPAPHPDTFQRRESRRLLQSFDRRSCGSDVMDDLAVMGKKTTKMNLTTMSEKWVIGSKEFDRSFVGSKSLNISKLRKSLPSDIVTPDAVALPYGCFQKTLNSVANATEILKPLTECLGKLKPDTPNKDAAGVFTEARKIVANLEFPSSLKKELEDQMKESGSLIQLYEKGGEKAAWKAVCEVWASMFGLRPWVSLSKAGRQYHELNMAVLVQDLLPANYAFVLHTKNPFDDTAVNEMYGEIVPGLGEVLVGNAPGRALSWRMKKGQDPIVVSFPSKQFALKGSACLIFRSDSNSEDLEGFAGAGLFESIPAEENQKVVLSYATIKLVNNNEYRKRLLKKVGDLAFLIEDVFGTPMDIEGCILDDETLGVVQARPQVF